MPKHDVDVEDPRLWDDKATTYQLSNARIVATLDEDGGAIVEHMDLLEVTEGRIETYGTDGRGKTVACLAYSFDFSKPRADIGEQEISYGARIVIHGTAANGRKMEIRGDGWIGHNERGELAGRFDDTPSIYTPDEDELAEHVEASGDRFGPKSTGDFIWATYGRAQDWT